MATNKKSRREMRPPPAAPTIDLSFPRLRLHGPWLAVACGALLVRLIYFGQIRAADLATVLIGDAKAYDAWGARIAGGDWLGERVFYQAPLYPYFLGLVYAFGGHDLERLRIVQALIGAGSCVLLGKAGEYFFSRPIGLVAGVLLALNPTAIFHDLLIQKAVLDLFLFTLVLMLTGYLTKFPERKWAWPALGAALGGLTLTRENALVILPWLLLWAWLPRVSQPSRRRRVSALALGVAVVLLPIAVRNWAIGGEFHLTTSQLGPNFYIGNNAQADGTYRPLLPRRGDAQFEQLDATRLAEHELGKKLTPQEVSDYWLTKSLAFMQRHPADWLKLLGRKWLLTWNALELGDTEEQSAYATFSTELRTLSAGLHFGIICPLAALGLVWTWSERKRLWILYAIALTYAVSVAAFFVFARYRLPLIPVAILFAAAALVCGARRLRGISAVARGTGLAAAVATAVFVNWPLAAAATQGAVTYCNLGFRLAKQEDYHRAIPYFELALAKAPHYDEAHCGLGTSLSAAGRLEEGRQHLETALRSTPNYTDAHFNLGVTWAGLGHLDQAEACYRRAIELDPSRADALNNLAEIVARRGDVPTAVAYLQAAVRADPNYGLAYLNLGARLFEVGRTGEAAEALATSARLQPNLWQAHFNLGKFQALQGRPSLAVPPLQRAAELVPADSPQAAEIRTLWAEQLEKLRPGQPR